VHQDFAQGFDHLPAVVFGSGRRPADDQNGIEAPPDAVGGRRDNGLQVVGNFGVLLPTAPVAFRQAGQYVGIAFQNLARLQGRQLTAAPVHQFGTGGDNQHGRLAAHRNLENSGGKQSSDAVRRNFVVLRKQQFGGHDVLAHFPNGLPGKGRLFDADPAGAEILHLFDHDDGVGALRHDVTGVDEKRLGTHHQFPGASFRGSEGLMGLHGNAVHGGGVEIGRRQFGQHRFGQHPAHGLRDRHGFPGKRRCGESLLQDAAGFLQRFHLQIYIALGVHR